MNPADEWIGVAEVADEMKLTTRGAWELVRRLGVEVVEGERSRMTTARFLRSAWTLARDRSMGPVAPRIPSRPSYVPASAPDPPGTRSPKPKVDKVARFRKL